MLILQFVIRM